MNNPFRWPQPRFDFRTDVRRWVMFNVGESMLLERFYNQAQGALCLVWGHSPERDQCLRPEHDFCKWCMKAMPNQWKPPGAKES